MLPAYHCRAFIDIQDITVLASTNLQAYFQIVLL